MRVAPWFLAVFFVLSGCTDDGDTSDTDLGTDTDSGTDADTDTDTDIDTTQGDIALTGDWNDNFGTAHSIDNELWEQSGSFLVGERRFVGDNFSSVFHIEEYSNAAGFALALNDAANTYSPSLYSRFDWTTNAGGDFVFCQTIFDGADIEAARAGSADASDLDAGCNGFSWSVLTAAVPGSR